ncbi:MAG: hypothetical protein RJA98_2627, partial [Pseudomonadota bacterium]
MNATQTTLAASAAAAAAPAPRFEACVVIVNWKVRELLREALRSLYAQGGIAPERLQVVVIDNNSGDGSVEMVREAFPQATLIANADNPGFGRANNQALPLLDARYLVLLNPDTVVPAQAMAKLVAHMDAQPDVGIMGCRLLNADGSMQRWTGGAFPRLANVASHYLFLDRLLPRRLRPAPLYLTHDSTDDVDVDWVSGACMILRPSMLDGKLFSPAFFMYGEDMELCHRVRLAGHRVVYTPVASIVHLQGQSMKQQSGAVLLTSLKGPRQFYLHMRGAKALFLFDLITVAGFALRWLLYGLASIVRPG